MGGQYAFGFCFSPLIMLLESRPQSESNPSFLSHKFYLVVLQNIFKFRPACFSSENRWYRRSNILIPVCWLFFF